MSRLVTTVTQSTLANTAPGRLLGLARSSTHLSNKGLFSISSALALALVFAC